MCIDKTTCDIVCRIVMVNVVTSCLDIVYVYIVKRLVGFIHEDAKLYRRSEWQFSVCVCVYCVSDATHHHHSPIYGRQA